MRPAPPFPSLEAEQRRRLRNALRSALLVLAGGVAPAAAAPPPVAPTAANWAVAGNAEFPPDAMADAPGATLRLNSGAVELRRPPFLDGTIEFDERDLFSAGGMDFPSIRFRAHGTDAAEQVYLRPGPDCAHADDCIQYAPVLHGCLLWDVYPQYQAGGPVHETGWNHVRIVAAGRRLRVFVNGAIAPSLSVDELEGEAGPGAIQLSGPALDRNVVISPEVVTGLPAAVAPLPLPDMRLVRAWRLAPPSTVPPGVMPAYADRPAATAAWAAIAAETSGFVNIGRRYGPPPRGAGAIAWLETTIVSDRAQNKLVSLGWAREIAVFVDGHPAFAGKNFYFGPDAVRRVPDGRVSLANASFRLRLRQGRNQIVAALNDFFPGSAVHAGWGLIFQLPDLDGITLDR